MTFRHFVRHRHQISLKQLFTEAHNKAYCLTFRVVRITGCLNPTAGSCRYGYHRISSTIFETVGHYISFANAKFGQSTCALSDVMPYLCVSVASIAIVYIDLSKHKSPFQQLFVTTVLSHAF